MDFVVYNHRRSERAGAEARDSLEADEPVGRSLALFYAEPLFERGKQRPRAPYVARGTLADFYRVPAGLLKFELRVKARD